MKGIISVIAIFVLILLVSQPYAAKVYTWTDNKGNLHISEGPPPENAKVKDVLDYEPQVEQGVEESEPLPEYGNDTQWIERKQQNARDAREQAEKAVREAQALQTKANQAVEKANEYISTHNRNQYMRRAYKYEMRKVSEEAKAAQEQARIAAEKARKAEKRARAAEEQAKEAAALPAN